MKLAFLLAAPLAASTLAQAQSSIEAPVGWKTQARAGGATTFTPPDLKVGEVYSVTTYDPAPLKGESPDKYLRLFAGPVGAKAGHLTAPLQMLESKPNVVAGRGTYRGPDGAQLSVVFFGKFSQSSNISVARILFSGAGELVLRYQNPTQEILRGITAGEHAVLVPEAIFDTMKRGGAFVPGIYAGTQTRPGGIALPMRVHLYAGGEWRMTGPDDKDGREGQYDYDARSGKLNIDWVGGMFNRISPFGNTFCFFGRDAGGKPFIYAEKDSTTTMLRYIGPSTKRLAPSVEKARDAAIRAEAGRYKLTVAPGKGVKSAQIAAVWWDQTVHSDGLNNSVTSQAYLLLRDGTIRRGLPVALDELDVARSRREEPKEWGRWRKKAGKYQVSWQGAPFEELKGFPAVPGAPGTRLKARYEGSSSSYHGTGSSFSFWGVAFDKAGRFSKDSSGSSGSIGIGEGSVSVQSGYDNNGSYAGASGGGVAVASIRKKNPNGDREGTYAINGYTITLRYDGGKVERLPFFFNGAKRKQVWFEGGLLSSGS